MTQIAISPKERAHELVELMSTVQVSAVVGLLEAMMDPVARSIAAVPIEDELIGESEVDAVAASDNWLKENSPISNDEVLAEFGLSQEDFDRMGRTPLPSESGSLVR